MTHAFNHDLNVAARSASQEMVQFLERFYELSGEDAYSLLSIAGDFSITQVANGAYGVHMAIPKTFFHQIERKTRLNSLLLSRSIFID